MLETLRDIAIIVLAVETIVIGVGVLLLMWQGWKLFGLVRRHADRIGGSAVEVLETAKDTAQTAQGTAGFVADRTARPVIDLYSTIAGASRFAQAVFSSNRDSKDGGKT